MPSGILVTDAQTVQRVADLVRVAQLALFCGGNYLYEADLAVGDTSIGHIRDAIKAGFSDEMDDAAPLRLKEACMQFRDTLDEDQKAKASMSLVKLESEPSVFAHGDYPRAPYGMDFTQLHHQPVTLNGSPIMVSLSLIDKGSNATRVTQTLIFNVLESRYILRQILINSRDYISTVTTAGTSVGQTERDGLRQSCVRAVSGTRNSLKVKDVEVMSFGYLAATRQLSNEGSESLRDYTMVSGVLEADYLVNVQCFLRVTLSDDQVHTIGYEESMVVSNGASKFLVKSNGHLVVATARPTPPNTISQFTEDLALSFNLDEWWKRSDSKIEIDWTEEEKEELSGGKRKKNKGKKGNKGTAGSTSREKHVSPSDLSL